MSGIFAKSRARFAGGPRTASKKLDHIRRAVARRKVLPGYPIETVFSDPHDVGEYLNSDRIVCLRCGKTYRTLGKHLQVHGWTVTQYREFYGLPWRTGLIASGTKLLMRNHGLQNIAAGVISVFSDKTLQKAWRAPHRKLAPFTKIVSRMNLDQAPTHDPARIASGDFRNFQDADYWHIPARMITQDRTMIEVCGDIDSPGKASVLAFARANTKFRAELDRAWGLLSFPVQARGHHLGGRFKCAVRALYLEGLTQKEIGERLGVNRATVGLHSSGAPRPARSTFRTTVAGSRRQELPYCPDMGYR